MRRSPTTLSSPSLPRRIVMAITAMALIMPGYGFISSAHADGSTPASATTASVENATRKAKAPKGMPTARLQRLIEEHRRGWNDRDCDADPGCVLTYKWSKVQWRGKARHCIAGQNYGKCERWATAYIARTNLLITETEDPDYFGKKKVSMIQLGYWRNGLQRIRYTDGYGAKEAWCEPVMGCGKTLLVWQDEFKDWFYSFANIGDCCGSIRLT